MERKRQHRHLVYAVGSLAILGVVGFVVAVSAATPLSLEDVGGSVGLGTADLKAVVLNVIRWLLGILALVAVSFIVYGGFLWLTAAGNTERIEKAKRVILNAVIGLVIVLISWAIVFFVSKVILNDILGGPGNGPPGSTCPPFCPPGEIGFEIRSITTDCGSPPDYRSDVFLCSAINVTFNKLVKAETVEAAVGAGPPNKLVVEECNDATCTTPKTSDPPLNGQVFTYDAPAGANPEWVARKTGGYGKTATFYHIQTVNGQPALFKPNTYYRVTIPKAIEDTAGNKITECRQNLVTPVPGCNETPTSFQWTMLTGTSVDTTSPKVTSTYPDSRYLKASSGYKPDRSVPMTPLITIAYDQAVAPVIKRTEPDPLNNTVAIIPFTAPPDVNTGTGGTLGTPVDPTTFDVQLDAAGPDQPPVIRAQMLGTNKLAKFTWYKVVVQGVHDLCNNAQDPEPFAWVFETNDTVPGIASHYPTNGTADACPDTPVVITYNTSMYDLANGTCNVQLAGGGYVTVGYLNPGPATGVRSLNVDPLQSCNGCANPQDKCKVFAFNPTSAQLKVDTTYQAGVDNRFTIDDQGNTLRFGRGPWGIAALGDWQFGVKPPGQCTNRPQIFSINPPRGTEGQCLTVQGIGFDPKNPGRNNGDDLELKAPDGTTSSQLSGVWDNTFITTIFPVKPADPSPYYYKVKADFDLPLGVIDSNEYPWERIPGPASTGPCLYSLSAYEGYQLDPVSAAGERFDPNSTIKELNFSSVGAQWTNWTDTKIDASVPNMSVPLPVTADVSVTNDAGTSNSLPYTVKDYPSVPPGTPVVIDRWPNCGGSCLNADIGAKFNKDIDTATFVNSVLIKKCTDATCTSFSGAPITPTVTYDGQTNPNPPEYTAHFPITLDSDSWYRVVLMNTIKSTAAEGGAPLGLLNYKEGNVPDNNAYSWTFGSGGAGGCPLDRVEVNPNPALMTFLGQTVDYAAAGFTAPNNCSQSGQEINAALLSWAWNSDTQYATVTKRGGPEICTTELCSVHAVAETVPNSTTIGSTATQAGPPAVSKTGSGVLTIDFTSCDDDLQCQRSGQCPGSKCVSGRCTPVINVVTPLQGAVGTWVNAEGCYFGSYASGQCVGGADDGEACDSNLTCDNYDCQGGSAVIYKDGKRGRWPDQQLCGSPATLWSESKILSSEVPDKTNAAASAVSGEVIVQRADGVRSPASNDTFIVDPAMIVPGICKINPTGGSEGTPNIELTGQNFGNSQNDPAKDRVTFYQEKDVSVYTSWSDSLIKLTAPLGIQNNPGNYFYPAQHPWGTGEVSAANEGNWGNAIDFNVVPVGCQICTDDLSCGSPTKGCGTNGCCADVPTVVAVNPTDTRTDVCRNTIISARFDRAMNSSTINNSSVHLYAKTNTNPLNFQVPPWLEAAITVSYDPNTFQLFIAPQELLARNVLYRVSLSSGGIIRSAEGVALAPYEWTFTTADTSGPCSVRAIEITPSAWTFPKADPADPDSQKQFTARAFADNGLEVSEVPNVYEWDWGWSVSDTTVADFSPAPGVNDAQATVQAKPKKGRTLLIAEAKPLDPAKGLTTPVAGSASIDVTACENLWKGGQLRDSAVNCIPNTGACRDFHFTISYCLDNDLPNLDQQTITGANGILLKEFLFKEGRPETRDAIGIRIYDNSQGLSVLEWYRQFAPNPGNPTSLTVDGYDAIRDGTTIYVGASDFDGDNFIPRIYLISYNQGASAKIVEIYNQMLASWFFNDNVNGICHRPPVSSVDESDKTCVQRDLKRLTALNDVTQYLRSYKTTNSFFPKLESGSFLPQLSFSIWPSWQQTLGAELHKPLPIDPKNVIVECPAGQAPDGTCWNETTKKFFCLPEPPNLPGDVTEPQTHIYGYKVVPDGSSAKLYANLEYRGRGTWITDPPEAVCSSPSSCQCFNYSFGP